MMGLPIGRAHSIGTGAALLGKADGRARARLPQRQLHAQLADAGDQNASLEVAAGMVANPVQLATIR